MTIGGHPRENTAAELAGLLSRVALRDEAAFAELYRQTSARLYGVVARILSKGDASAEALQDAYIRIWERAGDFDPARGSALAWMATIARNRALDEVRRVRPAFLEELPESFEPAADDVDPLAARERSETLSAVLKCLEALDAERRAILMLAYYRGLSREALAKRFAKPVPTIKTWLHRSLAQLRDCLAS